MSAQTIIPKKGNKLTIKGITPKQKEALVAGGMSFAALGMGIGLFKLFNPSISNYKSNEVNDNSQENAIVENKNDIEDSSFESSMGNDPVINDLESNSNIDLGTEGAIEEATYSFSFYSDVKISNAPSDNMSFDEAFNSARADVGAGGFFNYNDESYSTFYEEEWNNMSPENQSSFFDQVSEQSNFIDYVEFSDETETVDSVVNEYEVIESSDNINVELVVDDQTNAIPREHISVEQLEVKSNLLSEEKINIEDDSFFDSMDSNDSDENATEVKELSQDEDDGINIDQDDFFADLNTTKESNIGDDTEAVTQENESPDVVIVKPIYGLDSNMDDVIDMVAIDRNEDGIADVIALDEDYDGKLESFMINEDGGQNLDVFVVDQGMDGIDATDLRESIDDIVSMDDFVVLGENDIIEIENLDMIESLVDNSDEITQTDSLLEDSDQENFEDPGL